MEFVSLHNHTTFSYKDGYGVPEDHVKTVAERGMRAMAFTEHGNVSSHVRAEKAGLEHDVKTIFGCEIYTGGVDPDTRKQKKNHLTVLAKDALGYKNLLQLVSRGWSEGFYYEPTISGEMLKDHATGLIVLSGCTASLLATSLIGGKNVSEAEASYKRARAVARQMQSSLGDSFYLEVQPFYELESVCRINAAYEKLSRELEIPLVATADVHFCEPEDSEMRKILHAIRAGGKFVNVIEQEFDYTIPAEYPHSDEWMYDRLLKTGLSPAGASEAIRNTGVIADRCNVTLPKIDNLKYPMEGNEHDSEWLFRQWINDGWKYRGIGGIGDKATIDRYKKRLQYEYELIRDKGFIDYFLVVSDVVKYAKDSGIPVGPARGSAAASLVCYLLRITEVDPLPFPNLLFERFIDINRHDLPDIDLDFDDGRRWEIREYLSNKYGADQVGNIGTFTQFKGKNSLDDVARVYSIPKWEYEPLKNLLIERSSGDLRASGTIEDTVEMFDEARAVVDKYPQLLESMKLEGNYRGFSTHAAGLVVANGPLTDAVAVYTKTDDKTGFPKIDEDTGMYEEVVSVDKYDAEYLNVLKLDILGLKTMGMIRIALELAEMTLEELYELPLDDVETIEAFRQNDVVGVFQFDGRAMRNVCQSVVPDTFAQICDINALARPGPLHGGATAEYIDVKMGRKQPVSYGPIVDQITSHTFGQVVYQEQILQIVRAIGNFSWEEAALIRKIISKKRGEQEFNRQKGKFVSEAPKNGVSEREAEKLWSMLVTAGAYAFNAAHCVSYGLLAYWTMWLKVHHPVAFYVGMLSKFGEGKKGDKTVDLLRDADRHEVSILPPDPNESQKTWSPSRNRIRAGLIQVRGIGDKTADAILEYREELGEELKWSDLLRVNGIGKKTIETIIEFTEDDDPFGLNLLKNTLTEVRAAIDSGELSSLPSVTHRSEDVPYERGEDVMITWLGVVKNKNLKDLFENHFSRTGEKLDPAQTKDPNLAEWVVMLGEDDTDLLTITVDRWKYPRFKQAVWSIKDEKDLVLIRGKKKGFQARRAVYVDDLWVISMEDEK